MGFADLLDEQTGIGEGVNHHTQPPPQRVGHLYSLLQPGVRQRGEDAFGDLRVGTLHLIAPWRRSACRGRSTSWAPARPARRVTAVLPGPTRSLRWDPSTDLSFRLGCRVDT